MKKILYSIVALMFVGSVAFAGITISGQGSVKFNLMKGASIGGQVQQENSTKKEPAGETTFFDDWDLSDTDIWIIGETEDGVAGGQINITLNENLKADISDKDNVVLPVNIGDWDVWVKPFDFMTIKALNYGVRSMDRYVDIISELKDGYGVLKIGSVDKDGNFENPLADIMKGDLNVDGFFGLSFDASDADKLNGFILDMNFDVVQVELGLSAAEADGNSNWYDPVMLFAKDKTNFNVGGRVTFPVADILKGAVLYKADIDSRDQETSVSRNVIGAYVDIYAIENLNLAVGFTGDYTSVKTKTGETTTDGVKFSLSGIDVRAQYNMDKMGFAAHQNITFGSIKQPMSNQTQSGPYFAMKTKLGFSYQITDTLTTVVEASNTYGKVGLSEDEYASMDTVVLYPRVVFALTPSVELNAGLKGMFDLSIGYTSGGTSTSVDMKRSLFEVPLSMKVSFN
ncbi:MAG: hypothetical protein SPE30_02140 [Candidatus Treponema excrementipullorum]|nr:hypothetical protein [Candidatus Treponema excrementipullorum]